MRLSDEPRLVGVLVGLTLGIASWIGNASRTDLGLISAFPDFVTPAAIPLALYFYVRARLRASSPAGLRAIRRGGWSVVNTAAVVLALFLASVAGFWFNQWDPATITALVLGALVVTIVVGYISVELWARLMLSASQRDQRGDRRPRGE